MPSAEEVKPARERILDAAAAVMREKGVANATTKAIAAAADYSEAMLYKHFADKQELFLLVLKERLPALRPALAAVGTGDLAANLATIVQQLMDYFAELFPMSVSIFSAPDLLVQHREGIARHGGLGPAAPIRMLAGYLDEERAAGRIRADADTSAAAQLLVGIAFHQGFLAAFEGNTSVTGATTLASAAVTTILAPLT
ncbi:MAG: TetR family transcriptional regulator [Subtercola sp.]|jgi:AcrR family transcriptional regulator|nr:TetR family transcriptional regulator [Subtercola sp.]